MIPRLVLFDVDGTLVDSQAHIVAGMRAAFAALDMPAPPRAAVLSIVGLSLPVAMARLAPEAGPGEVDGLVAAYRAAFASEPAGVAPPPLFAGALEALERLGAREDVVLGVATGKSMRGLTRLLDAYDLSSRFITRQTADAHPSKPHPAMVQAALAETGVDAAAAVMVGDTTFDIEMACAAGVPAVGVHWGYHPAVDLRTAGAAHLLEHFDRLDAALDAVWSQPA